LIEVIDNKHNSTPPNVSKLWHTLLNQGWV